MGQRIVADIEREKDIFGAGGWIKQDDIGATGMQAVAIQCKIAGLSKALVHLQETNKLLTGKIEKKDRAA